MIYDRVKAEEEFSKTGKVLDLASTTNVDFQIVLALIKESLKVMQVKDSLCRFIIFI